MPNKQKQWVTIKISEQEMQNLEAYCQQTKRTKTDLIREMIRKLPSVEPSLQIQISRSKNESVI